MVSEVMVISEQHCASPFAAIDSYRSIVFVSAKVTEETNVHPSGANCARHTYEGKVLSSARESSPRHTGTGVGLPCEGSMSGGIYLDASCARDFLARLTMLRNRFAADTARVS